MIVEAAVELTIPDNTAYTALRALRALGYDELTRVERADLYRFDVSDEAAAQDVADAVERAEVIFNPNKHRLSVSAPAAGQASRPPPAQWEIIVADRDDDTTRLARLLADRFGLTGLRSLEQAISWRLFEGDASASKERLEWACRTLLCNPHSQISQVRARPAQTTVGDAARRVET